jgi:hypothetical protein
MSQGGNDVKIKFVTNDKNETCLLNCPFSFELIDAVFALVLTRKQQTMEANP